MPELPEVERARALIAEKALGRRIAEVDDTDTYVCRPHAPGEIAAGLVGRELTEAHRIGKSMWVDTDDGPTLGLHLGMAGRIIVDGDGAGDPAPSARRDRCPSGTASRCTSRTADG
jgi:formamidopyrimidine-DNA glycosylase